MFSLKRYTRKSGHITARPAGLHIAVFIADGHVPLVPVAGVDVFLGLQGQSFAFGDPGLRVRLYSVVFAVPHVQGRGFAVHHFVAHMAARTLRVANVFLFLFEHVLGRHPAVNPFAFHEDVDGAVGKDRLGGLGLASRESFNGVGMRTAPRRA